MAWITKGLYHVLYHDSKGVECSLCMYGDSLQEVLDNVNDYLGNGPGPVRDEPISISREDHLLLVWEA